MEAYTHYGKQADVFKHLVLCEVLNNEMPAVYIDTNSACAIYQMSHTPEQDYGIYHFLRKASVNDALKNSVYYRLESHAVQNDCYYGSPALSMKVIGKHADNYYFFDLENKSLDNVLKFAEHEHLEDRIVVQNCDSSKAVMDMVSFFPENSFLHIDPYEIDRKGIGGHTYYDIFIQATRLGMKCLLWYGFMTLNDKQALNKYMSEKLSKVGIKNYTCSELIMNVIKKDTVICNPGILGSGILATNLSLKSTLMIQYYSKKLVGIYKDARYKEFDGSLYNDIISKKQNIRIKRHL